MEGIWRDPNLDFEFGNNIVIEQNNWYLEDEGDSQCDYTLFYSNKNIIILQKICEDAKEEGKFEQFYANLYEGQLVLTNFDTFPFTIFELVPVEESNN